LISAKREYLVNIIAIIAKYNINWQVSAVPKKSWFTDKMFLFIRIKTQIEKSDILYDPKHYSYKFWLASNGSVS
jgi:hypothetical protein